MQLQITGCGISTFIQEKKVMQLHITQTNSTNMIENNLTKLKSPVSK